MRMLLTSVAMSLMLFAGIPVSDHATAVAWYERFFGRPASFQATDTESVWELAENRWVYVVENPHNAGHSMQTILVDDLDGIVAEITERGIRPEKRETYDNGARKAIYRDPDGNEIGYGYAPQSG
ncbi:Glyoxalase/Bleomycin resistance protein/Dioxygenase superfamily [Saccharomonospora cyanea NA-134]|uniref:Glyoxalase/Bleomycin resistance protein/Dioxygenase superfamily n=2 Tax=Saccharomonospora cyanea TaxID=40989 RepID=H5XG86_9PSEU|nr:Glyoxalase/Bleomycin resistance protein/Dioxygenase superfamily [Saccharomonospora cyanea NA-134]